MKLNNYHENFETLHIGTEQPRSYYIPCGSEPDFDFIDARNISNRVHLLNGTWNFKLYECYEAIPQNEFENGELFVDSPKIEVPSSWQYQGYGFPQYINTTYPIPFDPPHVPADNECAVYGRKFNISSLSSDEKCYINFEGVDSCFYLWINGKFVGFSQVSHSVSEFDVTDYINQGENEIKVLVLKWCLGTYLEDQDKFRCSGIFRDVYLIMRPQNHIRDCKITNTLTDDYSSGTVNVDIDFSGTEFPIKYSLKNSENEIVITGNSETKSFSFKIEKPLLWNAETPNLYLLTLEANGEFISFYVGFRKCEIIDSVLLLNGIPIKIHGVNRHDSHPEKGPAVSFNDILNDIRIMKAHNINAIRTSHYPNSPYMPALCDFYGMYMMSEADLEGHGTIHLVTKGEYKDPMIAEDSRFEKAFLDRQERLYERDKNHPSILFWSIGNETAFGRNIEKCAAYLKGKDPERIVHYEPMHCCWADTEPNYSNIDVRGRMYTWPKDIDEYFVKQKKLMPEKRKPFILCEYSHSMGNGPGDLEDYHELMEKYPEFIGGFVWEWCDHAFYSGMENGKPRFLYGGDFGEKLNDGNFCVDGLVYPDRKVGSSLRELKNVNRPARMNFSDNTLYITNKFDFTELQDAVTLQYVLTVKGKTIKTGVINDMPVIKPHETGKILLDLPDEIRSKSDAYIKINMRSKNDTVFYEKGYMLGFEQFCLSSHTYEEFKLPDGKVFADEDELNIKISGEGFEHIFDKHKCTFSSIGFGGGVISSNTMDYNLWRAPTDNDAEAANLWKRARYNEAYASPYEIKTENSENSVVIKAHFAIVAAVVQKIMDIYAEWVINAKGEIRVKIHALKDMELPFMPRFGVRLFLNEKYKNVCYFGKGPDESYIDKQQASYYDEFYTTVNDMVEDYIRPQENGSHIGTQFVKLFDDDGLGIEIVAINKPFSFSSLPYTQEKLENTKHNFELEQDDFITLCVDCFNCGVGSRSCGPKLAEKYKFDEHETDFEFVIKGLEGGDI